MVCLGHVISALSAFFEFFPLSSSAHFLLLQHAFSLQMPQQELFLQHLIPLVVLLVYFAPLWWRGLQDLRGSLKKGALVGHLRIVMLICVAALPLAFVGGVGHFLGCEGGVFGAPSLKSIGVSFVLCGALLFAADFLGKERKTWQKFGVFDACVLGVMQIFSLIVGASRLGLAITAARMLGYSRASAVYLGLLTGVPVLFGAQILHINETLAFYTKIEAWSVVAPFAFSILGLVSARFLLSGRGLLFVALYRIILGGILLLFF